LVVAVLTFGFTRATLGAALAPVEYVIDRSNMSTQWTLAWPQEPNITPFFAAEYNKPGNLEARRVAALDGIARVHTQWFRDGFGKGAPAVFVDLVHLVTTFGISTFEAKCSMRWVTTRPPGNPARHRRLTSLVARAWR
jgi:hypothetical protein